MTDNEPIESSESSRFSFRKATQMIRKLHIANGDVILLKHGTVLANEYEMSRLADALGAMHINAIIAVVNDFNDLSVLDEVDMLKHGWVRTRKIERIIPTKKNGDSKQP